MSIHRIKTLLRYARSWIKYGNKHAVGVLWVYKQPMDEMPLFCVLVMDSPKHCDHAHRACANEFCFVKWNFAAFPDWKADPAAHKIYDLNTWP